MKEKSRLNGTYKRAYRQIASYIRRKAQRSALTAETLGEVRRLLEDACTEGRPLEEVFPDGLEDFCLSVLQTLPRYTVEEEWHICRVRRLRRWVLGSGALAAAACLLLWYFGIFAYWDDGMWALPGQTRNCEQSDIGAMRGTQQPFVLELDLRNLESNRGRALLEPGELGGCRIEVLEVFCSEERDGTREYMLQLACYGEYSLTHMQYYYPETGLTPDRGNGSGINSSVAYEGKEIPNGVRLCGEGPNERDYYACLFHFLTLEEGEELSDPIVTLKFWLLAGQSYRRTGWGG